MTMTTAWEITHEDVFNVLLAHGLVRDLDDALVQRAYDLVTPQTERVVDEATTYSDLDDQTAAAAGKIEAILVEEQIITDGQTLFPRQRTQIQRTWREQLLDGYPNTEAEAEVREAYASALSILRDSIAPPAFPHTSPAEEMRAGLEGIIRMTREARPAADFTGNDEYTYLLDTQAVRHIREQHDTLEFDAFFCRFAEGDKLVELWGQFGLDPKGWAFPVTLESN